MCTYIYLHKIDDFFPRLAKVARRKSSRPSKHTYIQAYYMYTDGYNYYDIAAARAYNNNNIILLWFFSLIFFSRGRRLITQCVSGANRETACTLRGRLLFLHGRILPRIHNVNYRNYACAGARECV